MSGKKLIGYIAKGLSFACIAGILYNLFCFRGL